MWRVKMKVGIIGAGSVGQAIGAKLIKNGHDVRIGIRNPSPAELAKERQMAKPLTEWVKDNGGKVVSFADAAKHGEIVINATSGGVSIEALKQAGDANLKGKILIDIANPLDFSKGMPPSLLPQYAHGTSLGEEIQKAFPDTHVVKTLNTISNAVMVDASLVKADHDLFIAGNNADAKKTVEGLLRNEFGWKSIVDLGDIVGARGTEHLLPIWIRLWSTTGNHLFNIKVAR
jgi:8-hydroxy-5-deazaflavin:NADPH oxidoreductase